MVANYSHQKTMGKRGEDAAAAYLAKQGYRILARNYRCREGEIDLVAQEGEFLVFVEVKARSSTAYGYGRDAITPRKQAKIILTARYYLMEHHPDEPPPCRFDVAEVDLHHGEAVAVELLRDAFVCS